MQSLFATVDNGDLVEISAHSVVGYSGSSVWRHYSLMSKGLLQKY